MPADAYSSTLGYLIMGTGNDNNTWGDNLNASVFTVFEKAINGGTTHAVTGGTLDLSASPPPAGPTAAIEFSHTFTGVLTTNQTVLVPNLPKFWSITNATTGDFVLRIKTSGSDGVIVPQGVTAPVACFGSHVMRRIGARTGEIFMHGGTTAPAGSIACDGGTLSRTDYNELFDKISTTWGPGNGATTFNLPNMVNRFPRAHGDAAVGTYQANQIGSHAHTGTVSVSGNTGGQSADHTHVFAGTTDGHSVDHTHAYSTPSGGIEGGGGNAVGSLGVDQVQAAVTGNESAAHTHSFSGTSLGISANHTHAFSGNFAFTTDAAGGSETRPDAVALLMCIYL